MCRFGKPNICHQYNTLNLSGARRDGSSAFKDAKTGETIRGSFVGQSSFARHTLVDESACTKVPQDSDLTILGE